MPRWMLKGDAVQSFLMMFLQMWNVTERTEEHYERYLPKRSHNWPKDLDRSGYVNCEMVSII